MKSDTIRFFVGLAIAFVVIAIVSALARMIKPENRLLEESTVPIETLETETGKLL